MLRETGQLGQAAISQAFGGPVPPGWWFSARVGDHHPALRATRTHGGERTIAAIQSAEGKRLMYKDPVAEREYIKTREQKEDGEQLEPL